MRYNNVTSTLNLKTTLRNINKGTAADINRGKVDINDKIEKLMCIRYIPYKLIFVQKSP